MGVILLSASRCVTSTKKRTRYLRVAQLAVGSLTSRARSLVRQVGVSFTCSGRWEKDGVLLNREHVYMCNIFISSHGINFLFIWKPWLQICKSCNGKVWHDLPLHSLYYNNYIWVKPLLFLVHVPNFHISFENTCRGIKLGKYATLWCPFYGIS